MTIIIIVIKLVQNEYKTRYVRVGMVIDKELCKRLKFDHTIKWQITNKKENCKIVDFAVPADQRIKLKENEKKDKYLDLARELKNKTVEYESDGYINCNWCS